MRFVRRLLALLALCLATQVAAQSIMERLVTPGPLSAAHAKLEANCAACHESFSKGAQNARCLSCHKGVAGDVRAGSGYHGKFQPARTAQCKACHTDHKGRGYALVRLNAKGFNHSFTDYPLTGGHAKATCAGCHASGKRFRGTSTTCADCHSKKDPHRGALGRDCQSCHSVAAWKPILPFDHAKTGFVLAGAHRAATCASCHAGQRWKGTPRQCVACHAKDDAHKGTRGTACANCHNSTNWKSANFDHSSMTRFPLVGAHAGTACAACHGAGNAVRQPQRTCIGCHAKDDVHKGKNGPDCADCHNSRDWKKASFDHNSTTRFPLRGAHATIVCEGCHKQPAHQVKPPVTCIGCHADDDAHAGKFGQDCASCHGPASWKERVLFDHALTRFPLLGKHAALACTQCHADKTFAAKGVTCQSCHADDHHGGTLGSPAACADCHNAADWKSWRFDHDKQTSFPLTGKHQGLICSACHAKPGNPADTPKECYDCHRRNDVHRGGFGQNCARCHTTNGFSEIIM